MNKKNLNTKTAPILGVVFMIIVLQLLSTPSIAQQKVFNGLTGGFGVNGTIEYSYPRLGFSTDLFIRKKVYKKAGISLNWHRVKIQKFLFGSYPSSWLDYGTVDTYAKQFIGKGTDYFYGTKGTSFIINASTIDLTANYQFGQKNKIVPEFGLSVGVASETSLSLRGISSSNGKILTASSQSKFMRNFIYGVNLSIADQYWVNTETALFFKAKMILTTPRSSTNMYNVSTDKGTSFYESVSFGIGVIKKLHKHISKSH